MLSREEAFELIKKEKLQDNVIAHTMQVNKISNFLANELKKKGEDINLELVDVASLLHDIGRARDHKTHVQEGTKLLKKMNELEIAQIIAVHGLYPDSQPKTWEDKIVYYADKRVKHDEIVLLQERINDIIKRYSCSENNISLFVPIAKKVEKEIFNIIGWNKENLEEMK